MKKGRNGNDSRRAEGKGSARQGQRVLTLHDVDELHGRPDGTALRNFRYNQERFIEGEDYFLRNSQEANDEFGIMAPRGLILLTQVGYLMVVKSFTDDLSWAVQRELINGYFSGRRNGNTFLGTPVLTVREYCEATGDTAHNVTYALKSNYSKFPIGTVLLLEGYNLRLFKEENPDTARAATSLWIMTADGVRRLQNLHKAKTT